MDRLLERLEPATIAAWASAHGLRLLAVLVAAYLVYKAVRRTIPPAMRGAVLRNATPRTEAELRQRADTLAAVVVSTAEVVVLVVALFVALDELGFNVAPFLTGLGITGIALGLGAQSLVRDVINGVFILVENQYGKGDLIAIAGVQGWVEDVNLRRTVLRDADGTLFTVPNGEIKVVSNLTRDYSGISLLVPVASGSDIEAAMDLIDAAGRALAEDPRLGALVVEAPHAARVDGITEKGVTVRVLGKASPGAQFEVAGALRRRIKRAFDEAQIRFGETPAPPGPPPSRSP
ncbi:MAG: mechanosensitive ion channel family protein [Dehalococcoidia bacterium]